MAIHGDVLAVGANMEGEIADEFPGAAFVFERDPSEPTVWHEVLRVDGDPSLWYYGSDVDAGGDTVIFNRGREPFGGDDPSGGDVYRRSPDGGWELEAFLTAPDAGTSVAIREDLAAVGTVLPEGGAYKVYLFEHQGDGTWPLLQTLTASDDEPFSDFGADLALDGDRLAVGAPDQGSQGAVYVFERQLDGTWLETAKLVAPEPSLPVSFGHDLDLAGDLLVVGDPEEASRGADTGRTWVFRSEAGTWCQVVSLRRPDQKRETEFGGAVAIAPFRLAIGSQADDLGANDSGSVFIAFSQ